MDLIFVKYLHVLSSTLLFGTGIGTAFYLLVVSLHRDVRVVAVVARYVVIADWLFTATTVVFQPLSGFWMTHWAEISWRGGWVGWSVLLYAIAVACWLPVVVLQMRMRDLAGDAAAHGQPLQPAYWHAFRAWVALGVPAFFAFVAVFYLMVVKPPL